MKPIGTAAAQAIKQIEQRPQSSAVLTPSQAQELTPIRADPKGKTRLAEALLVIYDGLKNYGKQPEQLENAVKLFHFVLADYPIDKIVKALAYYTGRVNEFPAPADIRWIIERGNKPPFEKSVYVSISKKSADLRTSEEWEYMRDYEKYMVEG